MINTNLFPAIILAGPPHSGKSVLAFLLTQQLRELGIAHYLLRAVPDGEGDWFLSGRPDLVRTLRSKHKGSYSSIFTEHMRNAIEKRVLPLLVDVGGRPQGEQLGILKACTHSILLYRSEEERLAWRDMLSKAGLDPIAELRSAQNEEESITDRQPFLGGRISGLEREAEKRKSGMLFGALLERVALICSYDAVSLEQEHLRRAPFPPVNERELAGRLSVPSGGEKVVWSPRHLARIKEFVQPETACAIYGRGPVWLAAALAAQALPAPCAIFDARYGWLLPPDVRFGGHEVNLKVKSLAFMEDSAWVEIHLPDVTLEPEEIVMDSIEGKQGIVISGKMPRWLFVALARKFAPLQDWIGIDDPRLGQAVIVHSNSPSLRPGDVLSRPE